MALRITLLPVATAKEEIVGEETSVTVAETFSSSCCGSSSGKNMSFEPDARLLA